MKDRDNCITAINKYIKNHDSIMATFNSEYESVKANNKKLTDLNEQNEKDHATKRAAYQNKINETKDDEANFTNCGSMADSNLWSYVSSHRSDGPFSNWICVYRRTIAEQNRLMSVWDDENKFIPHTIQPLPTPPNDTVNLNCCSNKIDLSNSDQARIQLKNVDQKCNQNITNNNRGGGGGSGGSGGGDSGGGSGGSGGGDSGGDSDGGDSTNNNKNTDSETSTSDQYAKRRKIIIAVSIFLFIFLLLAITVGVFLVYN
jgi:hypothetical protein